jgi:phage gpG-like protein
VSAVDEFNKVVIRFENMSRATFVTLNRTMNTIGIMLVAYIRSQKLSGQVLNYRSGQLFRNIQSLTTQQGLQFTTTVGVFPGSRVPYAAIQESGGQVSIPAYSGKTLRFVAANSGDLVFTRTRRAYTVRLPPRPYVSTSVAENLQAIRDMLQEGTLETVSDSF